MQTEDRAKEIAWMLAHLDRNIEIVGIDKNTDNKGWNITVKTRETGKWTMYSEPAVVNFLIGLEEIRDRQAIPSLEVPAGYTREEWKALNEQLKTKRKREAEKKEQKLIEESLRELNEGYQQE